ncbi:MAG: dTMP kinase [Methylotenera sp.]|nr:dTMP kinase [Oligoflexia bacterium]
MKTRAAKSVRTSGYFVTFEGTEGAGKSTLIQLLEKRLTQAGFAVAVTREPGGTPVAEQIRKVILHQEMDPWTELFLYEAARAEHLTHSVLPALHAGKILLCDRFTDSTLAYQGQARGLPWKVIQTLNHTATRGLKPNLTVLLDIDPAKGLLRAKDPNRFEAEGVKFQTLVRKGFLKSRKEDPKRWMTVHAGKHSPEELADEVLARILKAAPAKNAVLRKVRSRG